MLVHTQKVFGDRVPVARERNGFLQNVETDWVEVLDFVPLIFLRHGHDPLSRAAQNRVLKQHLPLFFNFGLFQSADVI